MKITVLGANGKVGSLVVQQLLERGHNVKAFVHRGNLPEHPNLEVVEGDIYDAASVKNAVTGSDAVVSALGSWHTPKKDILTEGMKNVIPAMESAGIKRIVSLTGDGAKAPGDKFSLYIFLAHPVFSILAPKILHDGEDHIKLLADSGLDWTVLRSPVMTNSKHSHYQLSPKPRSLIISRRAVVAALVDQLESSDWVKQAPFLRPGL